MRKPILSLLALALAIIATPARAATVIFDDTFGGGSTLNNATPADPTLNSTAYQLLSSKSWSGQGITDKLRIGMVSTTSGIMECQALFTTNPVTLNALNDSIQLRITFTNTAGILSGTSQLGFGLFNSGGVNGSIKPVPGGLNGTLVNNQAGAATGYAQGWMGYFGQLTPSNSNHRVANRNAQTGASNQNQATATSGTSSSPGNPAPASVSANLLSSLTLAVGGVYTEVLTITKNGENSLAITNVLYSGHEPGGAPLVTVGGIATGATYLTSSFDSLSIAWRAAAATTMDVSRITVTKLTQADLPALYNVQLNGWTNNTVTGAARIGQPGDLWNNPDWTGVYDGSTNLFTGVNLLESSGGDLGVTLSMTAKYNNNAGDWNTGVFNHYTSQTAGTATPVLMDQVVKVDYSGSVNVMTLTFTGLPPSKLVTAYVYGAGNGAGQGSTWSLAPGNGGGTVHIVYDGSLTGRDVTLGSSKGLSWESLAGTTDESGNLTIVATGGNGSVWWQTYMNGLQLQVGGTAPQIIGLANQTVEDGTTVVLSPIVTGNPSPSYQWYENGTNLPGQTNPTLTLTNVTTSQNGYIYSLVAENAIGVASNSMTLTVNASVYSTMSVVAVSPANGASEICYDTPLTVTFSDTVSLGTIGSIQIFDASNPGTPVDTINAALGPAQQRNFPGDNQSFTYPTISISGNTVTIAPHFNTLTSNKTYYVTIDPKAFKDSGGTNFIGLTSPTAWQFTTKSGPANPNRLVVDAAGSGDFVTVQGAVNSIPAGVGATRRIISLRDGIYREIVNISGKHDVTFQGQSRNGTVISFPNNSTYQAANGGTTHARMNFKVNANDIVLDSLTVSNSTPQGGSQAEALMISSNARRCIVNNVELASRQDTILANQNSSQVYFYNSLVKGNFDYIWGGGNLFFEQCEIRTIPGSASFNVTAARTDTSATQSANFPWLNPGGTYTANGMSFVNCAFTADPGVGSITLAGGNGGAGNNVSWHGCTFAPNYVAPSASLFSGNYLFWQSENTTNGVPVTFAVLTEISGSDPELLAATNAPTWFYGWTPAVAPSITSQPANTTVTAGQTATFTVGAIGFPGVSYQWLQDGTNAPYPGATSATLTIPNAQAADAGAFQVIVSNSVDSVTSSAATLTVIIPDPPVTDAGSLQVLGDGNLQFSFSGTENAAYSIWATTNIALTPITSLWDLVGTGTFGASPSVFTDTNATNFPHRFYIITSP